MIKIDFLHEIVTILQKGLASDEAYAAVFHLLDRTVPFDCATLFLYDEELDKLEVAHQVGEEVVDLAREVSFGRGDGMASWVSQREEPIILESLNRSRPGKDRRFSSFVAMPLRAAGKLIGVLNLGHGEAGTYSRDEQDDYASMAAEISMVVETFRLRRELHIKNDILSRTLDELRSTQAQLVEKERLAAMGEIVVTVNHEINNPLTAIIGLAEILELSFASANTEKVKEGLHAILQESRRIQRITERLSNLTSSDSEIYVGDTRMTRLPA